MYSLENWGGGVGEGEKLDIFLLFQFTRPLLNLNVTLHDILFISISDYELSLGSDVLLASHDYPNRYPPYAYVLWTFHPGDDLDGSNVVLEISFGDVYLGPYDHLTLGFGSDPDNSTNLIYSYEYYSDYAGYPRTLFLEARNMFVEFNSIGYYHYLLYQLGFQIQITVRENLGTQTYLIFNYYK